MALIVLYMLSVDDDTKGQYFHSKYFPELKYFIQTGFDIEIGAWLPQAGGLPAG